MTTKRDGMRWSKNCVAYCLLMLVILVQSCATQPDWHYHGSQLANDNDWPGLIGILQDDDAWPQARRQAARLLPTVELIGVFETSSQFEVKEIAGVELNRRVDVTSKWVEAGACLFDRQGFESLPEQFQRCSAIDYSGAKHFLLNWLALETGPVIDLRHYGETLRFLVREFKSDFAPVFASRVSRWRDMSPLIELAPLDRVYRSAVLARLDYESSTARRSAAALVEASGWKTETGQQAATVCFYKYSNAYQRRQNCAGYGVHLLSVIELELGLINHTYHHKPHETVNMLSLLGVAEDERAARLLETFLPDWRYGRVALRSLQEIGAEYWRPVSEKDNVYFWLASRDKDAIVANWAGVENVLWPDRDNDERPTREYALVQIFIGRNQFLTMAETLLEKFYDKKMAETYLNSGNSTLEKIARQWAAKRGFSILPTPGNSAIRWGSGG